MRRHTTRAVPVQIYLTCLVSIDVDRSLGREAESVLGAFFCATRRVTSYGSRRGENYNFEGTYQTFIDEFVH